MSLNLTCPQHVANHTNGCECKPTGNVTDPAAGTSVFGSLAPESAPVAAAAASVSSALEARIAPIRQSWFGMSPRTQAGKVRELIPLLSGTRADARALSELVAESSLSYRVRDSLTDQIDEHTERVAKSGAPVAYVDPDKAARDAKRAVIERMRASLAEPGVGRDEFLENAPFNELRTSTKFGLSLMQALRSGKESDRGWTVFERFDRGSYTYAVVGFDESTHYTEAERVLGGYESTTALVVGDIRAGWLEYHQGTRGVLGVLQQLREDD